VAELAISYLCVDEGAEAKILVVTVFWLFWSYFLPTFCDWLLVVFLSAGTPGSCGLWVLICLICSVQLSLALSFNLSTSDRHCLGPLSSLELEMLCLFRIAWVSGIAWKPVIFNGVRALHRAAKSLFSYGQRNPPEFHQALTSSTFLQISLSHFSCVSIFILQQPP
jgi:hypothetical protein